MATQSIGLQKDMRKIVKAVKDRGFNVKISGSGHYRIVDPKTGQYLGTMAVSPSDQRALQRSIQDLTARGVLDGDPRKKERKKEMASTRHQRQLTQQQHETRMRLLEVMSGMGWAPGRGNGVRGVQSAMAESLLEVNGAVGTKQSAIWAIKETLKGVRPVGKPTLDTIDRLLDKIAAGEIEVRPSGADGLSVVKTPDPEAPAPAPETTTKGRKERKTAKKGPLGWRSRLLGEKYVEIFLEEVFPAISEGAKTRNGRTMPHGSVTRLNKWTHEWWAEKVTAGTDRGLGGVGKVYGNRIIECVLQDSPMNLTAAKTAETFLQEWHDGWRPAELRPEPEQVEQQPGEVDAVPDEAQMPKPLPMQPISTTSDTTINPTDGTTGFWTHVTTPNTSPQIPLHIETLALLPTTTPQEQLKAIKLAMRIMELEAKEG